MLSKMEKQAYLQMIARIEKRMQEGHPMFGDKGVLKNCREKLTQCK